MKSFLPLRLPHRFRAVVASPFLFSSLLFFTLLLVSVSQAEPTADPEQVVAEINGERIKMSALVAELKRHLRDEYYSFSDEEKQILLRQMLLKMVERKLLLFVANRDGFAVSDEQVQSFIANLKGGLPSDRELSKELGKYGMSEEQFVSGIQEDLAIKGYLDKNVFNGISISDEELKKRYNEDPEKFRKPKEVRARHILIKVKKAKGESKQRRNEEDALTRAREVLVLARRTSSDFAALARKYSEAANKGKGGDLGFFTKNQMEKDFVEAAFALEVGAVSDPVKTKFGFHIIKKEEERGGDLQSFEDVRDAMRARALRADREKRLSEHMRKLQEENKVIVYFR